MKLKEFTPEKLKKQFNNLRAVARRMRSVNRKAHLIDPFLTQKLAQIPHS